MFPLFHMAGWTIALGAWQARRPVHFVRVPDADDAARAPRPATAPARLYCIPAVWARILEHGVDGYDLVDARRSRHRHVGDAARAARARSRTRSPTRVTRIFYGSTEAGPALALADADLFAQAGQRRRRAAGRRGAPRRRRRGVRAQPVPDGRLLRRSRRDRRGAASTAGTTPATSARSTTRATSSIVGRARDVIRTGGETVAPPEVEAGARRRIPTSPRSRSSGCPTSSGARS